MSAPVTLLKNEKATPTIEIVIKGIIGHKSPIFPLYKSGRPSPTMKPPINSDATIPSPNPINIKIFKNFCISKQFEIYNQSIKLFHFSCYGNVSRISD